MSPASKSKSKDKKNGKETHKAAPKPSTLSNAGNGVAASAYNSHLGTFAALETSPTSSVSPLHSNGRVRNVDETNDQFGTEYDSVSNTGSWSGESEDHKEKTANPPTKQEVIPGGDGDKREKVRQKNEKKHQRQKERRAQELHERCNGYLMSRKLEKLAQQIVAMGFPHERATMALMINEGRVDASANWIIEVGEEATNCRDQNLGEANLKLDISEELSQIAKLETKYKCTKQEVERAVIACEGDLGKTEENLRTAKQDPQETGDSAALSNGKVSVAVSRVQPKPSSLVTIQQRRDDNSHLKTAGAGGSLEPGSKSLQPLKRIQPKLEWAKPQQTVVETDNKRWPTPASNPSASYSLAPSLQVSPPPSNAEPRYVVVGNEYKNLQPGVMVKEPVVMMQRPQSVSIKQQVSSVSISSSPPGTAASWHPTNSVDIMKSNGLMMPQIASSNQMYQQAHYQQQQNFVPNSGSGDIIQAGSRGNNHQWSRIGIPSPTLNAASSLGLFSGLGSTVSSGSSSPVDWSTPGSMAQFDYASIDWSLDRSSSFPTTGGLWAGSGSIRNNTQIYDSNASAMSAAKMNVRSVPNGSRASGGLQDIGGMVGGEASASGGGSREWSSPFEGKDLFSLPRQFVSSPL